jgi:hypothetical protein
MWVELFDEEDDAQVFEEERPVIRRSREVRERGDAWTSGWGVMLR